MSIALNLSTIDDVMKCIQFSDPGEIGAIIVELSQTNPDLAQEVTKMAMDYNKV